MAFQVLHQVVVEAVALQELEGIVPPVTESLTRISGWLFFFDPKVFR